MAIFDPAAPQESTDNLTHAIAHARVWSGTCWRVAGWTGLVGTAVILACLFNVRVTNGTGHASVDPPTVIRPAYRAVEQQYDPSRIHEGTHRRHSPATAELAGGDDVRAGLLADPAATCATQPLYAGQKGWVPLYSRCTDALP
jgi:hypothetical protein